MNLVKWFRKNNTKLMAGVVIVLMIGFIGGSALTYLLRPSSGDKNTMGTYRGHKIRYYDRDVARQELDILQSLGASQLLQRWDLAGLLLEEVLYPNAQISGELSLAAQRLVQQSGYRVSNRQLADIFKRDSSIGPEVLWLLLREESQDAGIYITTKEAGDLLAKIWSSTNGGPGYSQIMMSVVNRYKVPETTALSTFARLISVLEYADMLCSGGSMTTAQQRHLVAWESDGLDAEFVQFKASDFADKKLVSPAAELEAQFQKYKGAVAGETSEANPFGFGYKLPDRVQFEYIVVKLDDVRSIIKKPTQQEAETYYQQNRDRYSSSVRSDPNDPNSRVNKVVRSYSEVADSIFKQLTREKVAAKAELILAEARSTADANLPTIGSGSGPDTNEPTAAMLQAKAVKYESVAQDLSRKNGIPLYSGRTGLLSAADIQSDKQLSQLRLMTRQDVGVAMAQVLFSVHELGDHATVVLNMPSAKAYRSIGPLQDAGEAIMMVARVVNAEKAAEPANLDVTYSTKALSFGPAKDDPNHVYSAKDQVQKDLRLTAAWDQAKAKAQEFLELAGKDKSDWKPAIAKFNDLYGKPLKAEPNDPNIFRLDRRDRVQRIPTSEVEVYTAQLANSSNAQSVMNRIHMEQALANRLYSLVPADANAAPNLPTLMEFKPDRSVYALKSVTVEKTNQQQFLERKNVMAYRNEHVEAQSLVMVHFDPQNIIKRMDFKRTDDKKGGSRPVDNTSNPEDDF
jgi:hypothetical protein